MPQSHPRTSCCRPALTWGRAGGTQAAKNWNDFYRRNSTNFFKDRHWTWREFPELLAETGPRPVRVRPGRGRGVSAGRSHRLDAWFSSIEQGVAPSLLEVGCGVGNFVFPLLEQNKAVRVYACDFAKHAVELVKVRRWMTTTPHALSSPLTMPFPPPSPCPFLPYHALSVPPHHSLSFPLTMPFPSPLPCPFLSPYHAWIVFRGQTNALYDPERCTAFVCDLTRDELAATVPAGTLDLVTMIFVLSAIPPEATVAALRNVANVLAPGGLILFRDYGLHDQAQLRFGPGHRLEDQLYVRQDGTLALYFDKDWLAARVAEAGLEVVDMDYYIRETTNRKLDLHVDRIFVQGRFRRPSVHT